MNLINSLIGHTICSRKDLVNSARDGNDVCDECGYEGDKMSVQDHFLTKNTTDKRPKTLRKTREIDRQFIRRLYPS